MRRNDQSKNEKRIRTAIEEAIQDFVRRGLLVDSGRRRWSERTKQYQIVWSLPMLARFLPMLAKLCTEFTELFALLREETYRRKSKIPICSNEYSSLPSSVWV
jgi:hypothetical protein